MSAHTPGPWKYAVEGAGGKWAIVTDRHGNIVANVNGETGPDVHSAPAMRQMPMLANAALIAAAPEMLAALQGVAEMAGAAQPREAWWLSDVRAAIAKAEGRT